MPLDVEEFWNKLEATGEPEVRIRIARHDFGPEKLRLAQEWLRRKGDQRRQIEAERDKDATDRTLAATLSQTRASWINAYCMVASAIFAMIAVVISGYATFRVQTELPRYALVSQDGQVLERRNFGSYGLAVVLNMVSQHPNDYPDQRLPEYVLTFEKEPDYFEVTTTQSAIPDVRQIGSRRYGVRFIGAGFGSPVVKQDFRIQAY